MVLTVLEEMLALMIDDELSSIGIRLESKLLGDEAQLDIGLVTARQSVRKNRHAASPGGQLLPLADVAHGRKALPHDKHIHEICAHVRGVQVELEKLVIVAKGERRPHVQGVLDGALLLLCCG